MTTLREPPVNAERVPDTVVAELQQGDWITIREPLGYRQRYAWVEAVADIDDGERRVLTVRIPNGDDADTSRVFTESVRTPVGVVLRVPANTPEPADARISITWTISLTETYIEDFTAAEIRAALGLDDDAPLPGDLAALGSELESMLADAETEANYVDVTSRDIEEVSKPQPAAR